MIERRFKQFAVAALALGLVGAAAVAAATAGVGGKRTSQAGPRIAALYLAKFDENDYGRSWKQVLTSASKAVGASELKLIEGIGYTPQLTTTTEALFRQGYDIVIDTNAAGKLFYDACAKFPDKHCLEFVPAGVPPANTAFFMVDFASSFYLQGVAAGKLTKTGTIGYVASYKIPLIVSEANALALGCRSVRPDCNVRVIFLNSWFNPPAEVEATKTLISSGADVIATRSDDPTPPKIAFRNKTWGFIYYDNYTKLTSPKLVATVIQTKALTTGVTTLLKQIQAGSFTGGPTAPVAYGTPAPPDLQFNWGPAVPTSAKAAVNAAVKQMRAGKSWLNGPITDTAGKVRIPAGKSVKLRDPWIFTTWNWFVKGVIAS